MELVEPTEEEASLYRDSLRESCHPEYASLVDTFYLTKPTFGYLSRRLDQLSLRVLYTNVRKN